VLSAAVLSAEEAERIGLVQRVAPDEDLAAEARGLAAKMAEASPAVLAAAKRALRRGAQASVAEAPSGFKVATKVSTLGGGAGE